ncbi:isonocardicin synthase-like [Saccostrea cucullata]|uniref:isonocardicin synthase-like n=1 Tax=Saccostrea cuccullata TaxID=36930 RepID=UPI002ED2A980
MLLGLFVDQRITDNKVIVHFCPFEKSEKLYFMNQQSSHEELCSPPQGWEIDDAFDLMLSCGEERIRDYTIKFMASAYVKKTRLYDPACSTGVFLSTLKKVFPDSYTIGQDLNRLMTEIYRQRVDEVHCGNAMERKIEPGTAYYCFVRFQNSEVLKSTEAEDLLSALLPTVKKGG